MNMESRMKELPLNGGRQSKFFQFRDFSIKANLVCGGSGFRIFYS